MRILYFGYKCKLQRAIPTATLQDFSLPRKIYGIMLKILCQQLFYYFFILYFKNTKTDANKRIPALIFTAKGVLSLFL